MTKHDFRFTPEDHERMKEALDNLSDYPTEEEAEAALQACGSSGKEVVNEFIERLLKENLELKQELARRAAVAGPRGDALAELFDLFEKDGRGRWCFKSLSRDDTKLDSVMDRLAAATSSPAPAESDADKLVDEVQHRMDQVVEAAVEWHQAGREGAEWFEAAEKLGAAIDSLLELRDTPHECFCGTELEAGLCPNGHDPVRTRLHRF